ncbi:MAG: hypothetical protein A2046_09900 [Bacteroidetes bacterium GWA2_30_7]|nr:MAG: hypothetical protein A2046_09900 [Bacteroidetes bacterium GWA2_30_7]
MKVPLNDIISDFRLVKQKLIENFKQYTFNERSKDFIVIKKNRVIGANIIFDKKNIYVIGNIPSRTGNFLLILIILLLGVIIPLIFYFLFIHFKMKRLEKEICSFLIGLR